MHLPPSHPLLSYPLTSSINLLLGLLFPLSWQLNRQHPSPNIPSIFPQYMSKPTQSCLTYFLSKPSHLRCPLMYSFLILSILVTPSENLTSSTLPPPAPPPVFSSVPPSSARTTVLVSLPPCIPSLSLYLVFACRRSLLTFFSTYSILPALSSSLLLDSPLHCTVDPKYLKSSTFTTSSPCILPVPLSCLSFTHMYSVFLLLTFIPLLSSAYLQLSSFSSTCSLLSLHITVVCEHHGPWGLLPDLVHHHIHHDGHLHQQDA